MNKALSRLAVYPSQLNTFKERADKFASLLSELSSTKTISSFKRYDYLAMAVGYKGYSDLINASKFRAKADNRETLVLFGESSLRATIKEVFATKLPSIALSDIDMASEKMAESEAELNKLNRVYYFDEGSMISGDSQATANVLNKIQAASTLKLDVPELKIDLSEMPTEIYEVFSQHPALKAIDIDINRKDVRYSRIWHKGHVEKGRKDWVIHASFDIWGATAIPMDLLVKWNNFKSWLLMLNPTNRVRVCERIKDHSMITFHTQVHPDKTIDDLMDDLPTNADQSIFALFMSDGKIAKSSVEFIFTPNADGVADFHSTPEMMEEHFRFLGQRPLKKK
jgi:hypothetical protein